MRYRLYHFVAAIALLAACGGGDRGGTASRKPVVPVSPGLTVEPPSGEYTRFPLTVSVSTEPGYELYWALNAEPVVDPDLAYLERFSVRLVATAELNVLIRAQDGTLFGPYAYRYLLKALRPDGVCEIAALPRQYFRKNDTVQVTVQYAFPTALAKLEIAVNGEWQAVETGDIGGVYQFDANPHVEGKRHIACRIVQGEEQWPGNEIDFTIDATPPEGSWDGGGFEFDQVSWRNTIGVTASDALSGLAETRLCNVDSGVCVPMESMGGGYYRFATVMTDATSLAVNLVVKLRDGAGNETVLPARAADFTAYRDPVPSPGLQRIELTTNPAFDLVSAVGGDLAEVRRIDGTPLESGESPFELTLAPGWNEFAFRRTGTLHWETFAVYHAGLEVRFPSSTAAQWMVFSSASTYPALTAAHKATLEAPSGSGAEWQYLGFDLSRVYFIEDDGDGRWTEADRLFVNSPQAWGAPPTPGTPWTVVPVPFSPLAGPPAASHEVTVSVAPGLPDAPVMFEWRDTLFALPAVHREITAASFPADVSVPATGFCIFFLDTSHTGALSSSAPRAMGDCAEVSFTIASRAGPLAISPALEVTGLAYGSLVTGWVEVLGGDGTSLFSYPLPAWRDENGLGKAVAGRDFPFLRHARLPFRLRLYNEGQAAEIQAGPLDTTPHGYPVVPASVSDQTGAPVQALVVSGDENAGFYAATDGLGMAEVPVAGSGAQALYALRDGWLSLKSNTQASSRLLVLDPAVTGSLHGTVREPETGTPVVNAEVTWESARFIAKTRTDLHGNYALPASGGAGYLTIHIYEGAGVRAASYPFSVDVESVFAPVTAPATTPSLTLPAGLHGGAPPADLLGPGELWVGDTFYQAVTDGASEGPWVVYWSNGFRREVSMQGALPQFPTGPWESSYLPVPEVDDALLPMVARCGAWEQPALAVIEVQMPCWTWLAQDDYQTYVVGLPMEGNAYPDAVGFGYVFGVLLLNNDTMAQGVHELVLHDRLFVGRTIRIAARDGAIHAAVPYGVYDVKTASNAVVTSFGAPAIVSVLPGNSSGYVLTLP